MPADPRPHLLPRGWDVRLGAGAEGFRVAHPRLGPVAYIRCAGVGAPYYVHAAAVVASHLTDGGCFSTLDAAVDHVVGVVEAACVEAAMRYGDVSEEI